ncbi:hypothetical protein Drorol1_Dr00005092 [Drosera rotundifolia]
MSFYFAVVRRLSHKSTSTSNTRIAVGDPGLTFDKKLLSKRSARIASLLEESPQEDISLSKFNIPIDPEASELVARFCHGLTVNMATENIIPLICLADYLKMTESHSTMQLRLIDACSESLTRKALASPSLLGQPSNEITMDPVCVVHQAGQGHRPSARRRLFICDSKPEELISLPVHIYEPIIERMGHGGVPLEYIICSLCQYVKKWVCSNNKDRKSQREVIEAVERLLPCNKDLLACGLLFELLNIAIELDASFRCRHGIEIRIGKQLDRATVRDLTIPSTIPLSKEVEPDVESLKRILQSYYASITNPDHMGLVKVAKLMEDFLAEAATVADLKKSEFIKLSEMSVSSSLVAGCCLDGVYRAVDIYLTKHQDLTELEKEQVCSVLEFNKMTHEACDHAAQNQQLPLRAVVQVLFLNQLKLRDVIHKDDESMTKGLLESDDDRDMDMKHCHCVRKKKPIANLWQEVKRKFGCLGVTDECQIHVKKKKKVHP